MTMNGYLQLGQNKSCVDVQHTCSFNKHNTARVASCWFIIYYMLFMFRTPFASIIRSTINCNSSHKQHKHQWLLLQFIVLLKMDAKSVRNMQSIPVVVNKHNTARVASCWFIIYYIMVLTLLSVLLDVRCESVVELHKHAKAEIRNTAQETTKW